LASQLLARSCDGFIVSNQRTRTVSSAKNRRGILRDAVEDRSGGGEIDDNGVLQFSDHQGIGYIPTSTRRTFVMSLAAMATLFSSAKPSIAGGLVQFPPAKPFLNKYHFMRAGTSLLEMEDIWSTNPLFLTNREDALSSAGQEQVIAACNELKRANQFPTVLKYSLAAACIDTANIVGRELQLGRDRLVPEFTFMDPRAIGKWDMLSKSETTPAVWAMDDMEAGEVGTGARPPPNEDGTPHETLADQTIRLRQLFSVLESQYSGDTILLIFPDGTGPALLSAMIAGLPLNRVHELEFASGELRTNITPSSVKALWQARLENEAVVSSYQQTLAKGKTKLQELRSTESFVNLKDERIEAERVEMDAIYEETKRIRRKQEEENLLAQEKLRKDIQQQQQHEKAAARAQSASTSAVKSRGSTSASTNANGNDDNGPMITVATLGAIGAVGAALMGGKSDSQATLTKQSISTDASVPTLSSSSELLELAPNVTTATELETSSRDNKGQLLSNITTPAMSSYFGANHDVTILADSAKGGANLTNSETTPVAVKQRVNGNSQSTFIEEWPKPTTVDPHAAAQKAMEDYLDQDDGGSAWLMSLSEILEEEGDDDEEIMEESDKSGNHQSGD